MNVAQICPWKYICCVQNSLYGGCLLGPLYERISNTTFSRGSGLLPQFFRCFCALFRIFIMATAGLFFAAEICY